MPPPPFPRPSIVLVDIDIVLVTVTDIANRIDVNRCPIDKSVEATEGEFAVGVLASRIVVRHRHVGGSTTTATAAIQGTANIPNDPTNLHIVVCLHPRVVTLVSFVGGAKYAIHRIARVGSTRIPPAVVVIFVEAVAKDTTRRGPGIRNVDDGPIRDATRRGRRGGRG